MALIKCPNCGEKISDQAIECPKCGIKMNSLQDTACLKQKSKKKAHKKKVILCTAEFSAVRFQLSV